MSGRGGCISPGKRSSDGGFPTLGPRPRGGMGMHVAALVLLSPLDLPAYFFGRPLSRRSRAIGRGAHSSGTQSGRRRHLGLAVPRSSSLQGPYELCRNSLRLRFDFLVTPGPMVVTNSLLGVLDRLEQLALRSSRCLFLRLVEGFPSELTAGVLSCWNITLRDVARLLQHLKGRPHLSYSKKSF